MAGSENQAGSGLRYVMDGPTCRQGSKVSEAGCNACLGISSGDGRLRAGLWSLRSKRTIGGSGVL